MNEFSLTSIFFEEKESLTQSFFFVENHNVTLAKIADNYCKAAKRQPIEKDLKHKLCMAKEFIYERSEMFKILHSSPWLFRHFDSVKLSIVAGFFYISIHKFFFSQNPVSELLTFAFSGLSGIKRICCQKIVYLLKP